MLIRSKIALLSAGAFVVCSASNAHADGGCSNGTLRDSFAMTFSGQVIGTLSGTPPVVIPFPTPNLINGVQIFTFDGAGTTEQLVTAVRNGAPAAAGLPGLTEDGFQPQTGTYSVAQDCTGTGTIVQPNMTFEYAFVIGNNGRLFSYVVTSGHSAMIPGNPNCVAPSGCDLAVNETATGEKVAR